MRRGRMDGRRWWWRGNEETLQSALDVQLLAQEVLCSDSSLLPGILGYISGKSLGLEANGVDRGLYPPST